MSPKNVVLVLALLSVFVAVVMSAEKPGTLKPLPLQPPKPSRASELDIELEVVRFDLRYLGNLGKQAEPIKLRKSA